MLSTLFVWAYHLLFLFVVAYALIGWIPGLRWHPFGRLIYNIVDPMLRPFRRLVGPIRVANRFVLDLSPLFLLLATGIVCTLAIVLLQRVGM
jgi:uncharacterized protein YggT (Ycf19 family)